MFTDESWWCFNDEGEHGLPFAQSKSDPVVLNDTSLRTDDIPLRVEWQFSFQYGDDKLNANQNRGIIATI